MSNAVGRGHGGRVKQPNRGLSSARLRYPSNGHVIDHNVNGNMDNSQYVTPVIASNTAYATDYSTVMQNQAPIQHQTQIGAPYGFRQQPAHQYPQQPYYNQQQQYQPHYQQTYVPQQNFQPSYPSYPQEQMYQQPPPTVTVPPPQPAPSLPVQRERKILLITDPKTNECIDIGKKAEKASAVPAPVVPVEEVERREQTKCEFLIKVKKELGGQESTHIDVPVETQRNTESTVVITSVDSTVPLTPKVDIITLPTPDDTPPKVDEKSAQVLDQPKDELFASTTEIDESEDQVDHAVRVVLPDPVVIKESAKPFTVVKEDSKEGAEPDDKFDEPETPGEDDAPKQDEDDVEEKSAEELAKEAEEKAAADAEKLRLREVELEQRISELREQEDVNVEKGVYGRDFMVTVRQLENEFKRTPCPLSPAELTGFGLDIKSMTLTEKKTNFTPSWANQGNKGRGSAPYRGRNTTDLTGRNGPRQDRGQHNKKPPVVRPSIERVQRMTLPSSENAWKPGKQKTAEDIPEEEAKVDEVCKKVRSLMNKVTPTSKAALTKDFLSYNVSSHEGQLKKVVDIIFDKAVEEPKFCSLYAEVCKTQVDNELKLNNGRSHFRNAILTRAQLCFQDKNKEENKEKTDALEAETDPAKKEIIKAEIAEEKQKFRRRKFGNMTFIGNLFRNQLLSTKIIQTCVFELFFTIAGSPTKQSDIDEESVHCALQLIETLGSMIDKAKDSSTVFLDQWFGKLEAAKPLCSNKIRFMIMNVIELRKNKWVPRKSVESGPKKIDEIHKDIKQEQIENDKARDMYDRKHGGVRTNSNSLRKQAPASRNSIERNRSNQNPEIKRATAAASTKLTSSSVQPKNISLSGLNDSSLGKPRKGWHSGASGGGSAYEAATAAPQPANAWTRRDSNDHRKKSSVDEKQAALAAAKEIAAGHLGSRRSTSQNSIAENVPEEELTDEQQDKRNKLMKMFQSDINEVLKGLSTVEDVIMSINEAVGNEKYAKPSLTSVYEMAVRAVSELSMKPDEIKELSYVLRCSLIDKARKVAFIDGVTQFCKFIVDGELWCDYPKVWSLTGETLVLAYHPEKPLDNDKNVEPIALKDMKPIFLAARMEGKKRHELVVDVLKRMAEIELKETGSTDGLSWDFGDLDFKEDMLKDGLSNELTACQTSVGKNLKELLSI